MTNAKQHEFSLRVYYHDTDQMGVAYHANFIKWFEMARTELIREAGKSYKDCEADNVFLPVAECQCKYFRSAHYDDLITIKTITTGHSRVRLIFSHQVFNQHGDHLADGKVVLCCVDKNQKVQALPEDLRDWCMGFSTEKQS